MPSTQSSSLSPAVSTAAIAQLPKVQLHSHLDGALRPQTLIELFAVAPRERYSEPHLANAELPPGNAAALAEAIRANAEAGDLVRYLKAFDYTVASLQTPDALFRVSAEYVVDRAAEGVIYGEVRIAPEQHRQLGLTSENVVDAVLAGLREGERQAAAAGRTIRVGLLVDALRQHPNPAVAVEAVQLAIAKRSEGTVGFDIAGPEAGFPPSRFAEAFALARAEKLPITIHAGEADGLDSISAALDEGAMRLGHGVRLAADIQVDASTGELRLGPVAQRVRDLDVAIELCPTSNVHTGATPSWDKHPFTLLTRAGFRTTISCDNELVSGTTMVNEFARTREHFGCGPAEWRTATLNSVQASFVDGAMKTALVERVEAGYAGQ